MPDIARTLKDEISRIARKEIRGEISNLRKATTQQRTQISQLRKTIAALEKAIKTSSSSRGAAATAASATETEEDTGGLRWRPGGLASHRQRLRLSAEEFGKLIGVSGQTIYKWEKDQARPRRSQMLAISKVRKLGRREALKQLGHEDGA